jgi:hypothetical protein
VVAEKADRRFADTIIRELARMLGGGEGAFRHAPEPLEKVIDEGWWREREVHETGEVRRFTHFADFVVAHPPAGLGSTPDLLLRICKDTPLEAKLDAALERPAHRPATNGSVDIIHSSVRPDGTGRQRAIRRLRRQRPDLLARVEAGEMSPHAAMIAAGFRRPTFSVPADVEAAAATLRRKFSREERLRLRELLSENGA